MLVYHICNSLTNGRDKGEEMEGEGREREKEKED